MGNNTRILVVDDEVGLCDFISHYLRNRGFEVEVAFGALEALSLLQQTDFDLVLADIMMPTIDGLEMLRRIKEAKPQTVVVLMTAYASIDKAMKAITYGAADLLIKPFQMTTLLGVIKQSLENASTSNPPASPISQTL